MKRLSVLFMLFLGLLLPLGAAAGTVTQGAEAVVANINAQIANRLGIVEMPARGISVVVTTPVDLSDLEGTNPLARQVAEELARGFVQQGYQVQEIRKGRTIMFDKESGEMILTRRVNLLDNKQANASLIMAGTYTITNRHVRFNIRLVHMDTNEVFAMAAFSVPMTTEIKPLIIDAQRSQTLTPSTGTRASAR